MIKIRTAQYVDAAALAVIFRDDLGEPDCTQALVEKKLSFINTDRECVFVAQDDNGEGTVCGVIHVELYDVLYFERMVNILGLAVSGNYRRRGVGKMLLAAAETWGKEHGAEYMRINSGESRKGAHEFYRTQGCDSEKMQVRFLKKL